MQQPRSIQNLLHRAGFDVSRWPRLPGDWVMDSALDAVIRTRNINCVLDVGGNLGQFGQQIRSYGYKGRIVSFEPSPEALPKLSALARRDASWEVRPVALGSESGVAELHLHKGSEFDSLHAGLSDAFLPDSVAHASRLTEVGTATITLSTLAIEYPDAIAGINNPQVLLKSDTQGHDLDVIKGANGLAEPIVAVLVELSAQAIYEGQPRMTQLIDHLQTEGFAPVAFQPVSRSSDDLRVIEFDGLFMRAIT